MLNVTCRRKRELSAPKKKCQVNAQTTPHTTGKGSASICTLPFLFWYNSCVHVRTKRPELSRSLRIKLYPGPSKKQNLREHDVSSGFTLSNCHAATYGFSLGSRSSTTRRFHSQKRRLDRLLQSSDSATL